MESIYSEIDIIINKLKELELEDKKYYLLWKQEKDNIIEKLNNITKNDIIADLIINSGYSLSGINSWYSHENILPIIDIIINNFDNNKYLIKFSDNYKKYGKKNSDIRKEIYSLHIKLGSDIIKSNYWIDLYDYLINKLFENKLSTLGILSPILNIFLEKNDVENVRRILYLEDDDMIGEYCWFTIDLLNKGEINKADTLLKAGIDIRYFEVTNIIIYKNNLASAKWIINNYADKFTSDEINKLYISMSKKIHTLIIIKKYINKWRKFIFNKNMKALSLTSSKCLDMAHYLIRFCPKYIYNIK